MANRESACGWKAKPSKLCRKCIFFSFRRTTVKSSNEWGFQSQKSCCCCCCCCWLHFRISTTRSAACVYTTLYSVYFYQGCAPLFHPRLPPFLVTGLQPHSNLQPIPVKRYMFITIKLFLAFMPRMMITSL